MWKEEINQEMIMRIVSEALSVDPNDILVQRISQTIQALYLPIELDSIKSKYPPVIEVLNPFVEMARLRNEYKRNKSGPFAKIEKLCKDVEFGELVIKIQNGNPVFVESVKKQIKLR
jgi:hypothetical protein